MFNDAEKNKAWANRVQELLTEQQAEDQARLFGKPRIYFHKKYRPICKTAENR